MTPTVVGIEDAIPLLVRRLESGSAQALPVFGCNAFPAARLTAGRAVKPHGQARMHAVGKALVIEVTSSLAVWRGDSSDALQESFNLVLPIDGAAVWIGQSGRRCEVGPGSMCLIDGRHAFHVEPLGTYHHVVVALPREAVLARHPHLAPHTAQRFDLREPGTAIVHATVMATLGRLHELSPRHRSAAMSGLVELLGLTVSAGAASASPCDATLLLIDERLAQRSLTAESLAAAQRLSRRRLDALFVERLGKPVAAHIAERRLDMAAQALLDPAQADRAVADIASDFGFVHASQFSRVFRRRRGCTPTQWRRSAR